jgi:type VI secretion system protein ImpK
MNEELQALETGEDVFASLTGEATALTKSEFQLDPPPPIEGRLEALKAARNPLLEACKPLLRVLSEMPTQLPEGDGVVDEFRDVLDHEVKSFQALCDKASLRREHVLTARYCLCTAIDEAASSTSWGQHGVWAQSSLAQRFHQDIKGGEKFFLLLGRLSNGPQEHEHLLEVMYRILGLGFQGIYSASAESRRELESLRHRLLTILRNVQEPVDPALSPRWQGAGVGKFKILRSVPVWVSASVLGLVLFSVFAWHKYWLVNDADALRIEIAQIAKLTPAIKSLRLSELLKAEITAGLVSVTDGAKDSRVVFKGDDVFQPARAEVSKKVFATLDRLAVELAKLQVSKVVVVGYTDSQAISTAQFPSNEVLSEKRAQSVSAYLGAHGVDKAHLQAIGKGASDPLDDNQTPQGRARNRRVEILVTP